MKRTTIFLIIIICIATFLGCSKKSSVEYTKNENILSYSENEVSSHLQNDIFDTRSVNMQSDILKEMNSIGLSRVSNEIYKNIRKYIKLQTNIVNEEDISIGSTKIGGRPDVPPNFEWPGWKSHSLSFIAQINLGEVSKYDLDKLLPSSGILYFFYDANQGTWGFDPKDICSWKVIYYNGDTSILKRVDFPGDLYEDGIYTACDVGISCENSFPAWESCYIDDLKLNKKETNAYFKFCDQKYGNDLVINKLLGHPDQIQRDMQPECQLVSNGLYCGDSSGYNNPKAEELIKDAKDWRLLLQVDSDTHCKMMWGDMGRLYFWIKEEDLVNMRFENVWMILQCG